MSDTSETPTIKDVVWMNEVEPFSPKVTPDPISPHMVFHCVQANSDLGDTTALFAGYNLGWPYTTLYGGQLPAPINIVAIDTQSGDVYFSPVYYSTRSIQQSVQLLLDESDLAAGEPEFNRSFQNAWFNADLGQLLSLPPTQASYNVCLWLDDLVTPLQHVAVPQNTNRGGGSPYPHFMDASPRINVGKNSNSPNPEAGVIRTDGPLKTARGHIFATLPQDGVGLLKPATGQPSPILTILGFTQKSRQLFWYSDTAFFDRLAKKGDGCFDFNPFDIIEQPEEPENVFVVTILGNLRSESLWVPADYFS